MNRQSDVVFERCPVCETGEVEAKRVRKFLVTESVVGRCSYCGATFIERGDDAFQLRECGPGGARVVVPDGRNICNVCLAKGFCLLGRVWSRQEWERLGRGEPTSFWEEYQEQCRLYRQGNLPSLSPAGLPFDLAEGEVLRHVSWPVYAGDVVVLGGAGPAYHAYLTNQRLVLMGDGEREDLRLEGLEGVEETNPGFTLREAGSPAPRQFYVGLLDPLAAAIAGALKVFRPV
jgi:hypothetical protein